eukprot:SAG22_NODE_848_length_6859_cov_5.488905_3_plen_1824_part_00
MLKTDDAFAATKSIRVLFPLLLMLMQHAVSKCPPYVPSNTTIASTFGAVPVSERSSMVWVSLSGYDEAMSNTTLRLLQQHRRSITHVSLVAYNFNGSKDGHFDHAHGFAPIDPILCSQCRKAVLDLAADKTAGAPQLQPLIGDPPWGHKTRWYEAVFAEPEQFIAAAVDEARRLNFSGYNLDVEPSDGPGGPTPQSTNRTFAKMYAQFASQFAAALNEHGLVLGVDTVCIDWANVDTLNASKADRLVSMDTYGCTCGGAADLEFTNVLLHGIQSAGQQRFVAGLQPNHCPLSDAQVRSRFAELEAAGVGALAIWGVGSVGAGGDLRPITPSDLWWECLATFLGRGSESFTSFSGKYFSGTGDVAFLENLDIARRMWSPDSVFQSIPMLYSFPEDGMMEGPTWSDWWTQNSYGTSMAGYIIMDSFSFYAWRNSQNWWFKNMANGSQAEYKTGGWAPDGTSCDGATPTQCQHKQGDGTVSIHDWALEETVSAVVMQAELLLTSRNMTAILEMLPYFLRVSNLLEGRRDPATGMTLFLSGPASNLLAPSFGSWKLGNGRRAWSYLTGLCVTYVAALDRVIELEQLVGGAELNARAAMYEKRRSLTLKGLEQLYDPTGSYFVRSLDPNGTKHGVIGQSMHGYFDVWPNQDAVAWRVVDDKQANKIWGAMESLGESLRPNQFVLPNVPGYDDMPCGDEKSCGHGLWEYGYWVNGGVWTTAEARMIMAYYRLSQPQLAKASMRQMVENFARTWRMDNPLTNRGATPYQPDEDINLTVDNFGVTMIIRGLFEYLFRAHELVLIPHLPRTITAVQQKFGIRWGAYRLFVDTTGSPDGKITDLKINGAQSSSFNATAVTLLYDGLPAPSSAAIHATTSSISTESTRLNISISFGTNPTNPRAESEMLHRIASSTATSEPLAPLPVRAALALWFDATTIAVVDGARMTQWKDQSGAHRDASAPLPAGQPTFRGKGINGLPSVEFDGVLNSLGNGTSPPTTVGSGSCTLGAAKTVIVVMEDFGSKGTCCNGIFTSWYIPDPGPGQQDLLNGVSTVRTDDGEVVLSIDYAGSGNRGSIDMRSRASVVSVTFNSSASRLLVDTCDDGSAAVAERPTHLFSIGSRRNEPSNHFKGQIGELLVYNRSLTDFELSLVNEYLRTKWKIGGGADVGCTANLTFPCSSMRDGSIAASVLSNITRLISELEFHGLQRTVVAEMAQLVVDYLAAFSLRCADLNSGDLPWTRGHAAAKASLESTLAAAKQIYEGMQQLLRRCTFDPEWGGDFIGQKVCQLHGGADLQFNAAEIPIMLKNDDNAAKHSKCERFHVDSELTPSPQHMTCEDENVALSQRWVVAASKEDASAWLAAHQVANSTRLAVVTTASLMSLRNTIAIGSASSDQHLLRLVKTIPNTDVEVPAHPEGYWLMASCTMVVLLGNTTIGAFHGAQTLLQLLGVPPLASSEGPQQPHSRALCACNISDWPVLADRVNYIQPPPDFLSWSDDKPDEQKVQRARSWAMMASDVMAYYKLNVAVWAVPEAWFEGIINHNDTSYKYRKMLSHIQWMVAYFKARHVDVSVDLALGKAGVDTLTPQIAEGKWVQNETFTFDAQNDASPSIPFVTGEPQNGDFKDLNSTTGMPSHWNVVAAAGCVDWTVDKSSKLPQNATGHIIRCEATGQAQPSVRPEVSQRMEVQAGSVYVLTLTSQLVLKESASPPAEFQHLGKHAAVTVRFLNERGETPSSFANYPTIILDQNVTAWKEHAIAFVTVATTTAIEVTMSISNGTACVFSFTHVRLWRLDGGLKNVINTSETTVTVTDATSGQIFTKDVDYLLSIPPMRRTSW